MTSKAVRREQNRIRVTSHRARAKRGMGIFSVEIHKERLAEVLKGWGMPKPLTWRRDKVEGAVGELIELILTDKSLVDDIGELIVERRSRRQC
jgi:hypothetical protein